MFGEPKIACCISSTEMTLKVPKKWPHTDGCVHTSQLERHQFVETFFFFFSITSWSVNKELVWFTSHIQLIWCINWTWEAGVWWRLLIQPLFHRWKRCHRPLKDMKKAALNFSIHYLAEVRVRIKMSDCEQALTCLIPVQSRRDLAHVRMEQVKLNSQ